MLKVFLNPNYKPGACTRVVLAVASEMPQDGIKWQETSLYEPNTIESHTFYAHLYTSGNVKYFGFL